MLSLFTFLFTFSECITEEPSSEQIFLKWMRETKNYYTGEDYHYRFAIWLTNYQFIQSRNKISSHFKCGMNGLSALTPSEYRSYLSNKQGKFSKPTNLNSQKKYDKNKKARKSANGAFPDFIDHRIHDPCVINPIQNVGECKGAGWAFSITTSIETNHCLRKGVLYKLSEQCLIDCVDDCDGCNSGTFKSGFNFLLSRNHLQGLINNESDYPWIGSKSECKFEPEKCVDLINGVSWNEENVEENTLNSLNGPSIGCVSIDASLSSFQLYSSGIYDDEKCSDKVNHDVNVVGYGIEGDKNDENSVKYWICRNCWGESWGENGYFRILRDVNQCGIGTLSAFPLKL